MQTSRILKNRKSVKLEKQLLIVFPVGISRVFSKEIEVTQVYTAPQFDLVRSRLIAFLHAHGNGNTPLSVRHFAQALNDWERLDEWYSSPEEDLQPEEDEQLWANDNDSGCDATSVQKKPDKDWWIKIRALETWIKGDATKGGGRKFTRPEAEKFEAISEYLIECRVLSHAEFKDIANITLPAHLISADYGQSADSRVPKVRLSGEYRQYVIYSDKAFLTQLFLESTSEPNVFCVQQFVHEIPAGVSEKRGEFEARIQSLIGSLNKRNLRQEKFWCSGFAACLPDFSFILLRPSSRQFADSGMYMVHSISSEENGLVELSLSWVSKEKENLVPNIVFYEENNSNFLTYYEKFDIDMYIKREFGTASGFYSTDGGEFYRNAVKSKDNLTKTVTSIDQQLFDETWQWNHDTLEKMDALLDRGANVNYQEPIHGYTPLHMAAARNNLPKIELLMKRPEIDYLVQNNYGELPSMLAHDPEIIDLLAEHENRQARQQGRNYIDIINNREGAAAPEPLGP